MSARTFVVIPDLHGRLDALEAILRHAALTKPDGTWAGEPGTVLIQLGDLLDRGPESRACVERLMDLQTQAGDACVVLKGNHEELMEHADRSAAERAFWMLNGGREAMRSYGDQRDLIEPGGSHYRWLKNLPLSYEEGGVFFVHAGLSAANAEELDPHKLLWERPPLVRGHFCAVVCGHTPTDSGRVEEKDGVFRCDIGLGYGRQAPFEYLALHAKENEKLTWEIRTTND